MNEKQIEITEEDKKNPLKVKIFEAWNMVVSFEDVM